MIPSRLFRLETAEDVLTVVPLLDMGEFNADQVNEAGQVLLEQVDAAAEKNIVIDFSESDYFGSDALGLFVHLWKKAAARGGRIVFCGASDLEKEILLRAKFDHIGPICAGRAEALAALRQP